MAADKMTDFFLEIWVNNPKLKTDPAARAEFEERFRKLPYKNQYQILTHLFSKWTETEHQYWIMNLANLVVKQKNASYRNSDFKSQDTMTEHFIKNFSSGELLELRTTIWSLMK